MIVLCNEWWRIRRSGIAWGERNDQSIETSLTKWGCAGVGSLIVQSCWLKSEGRVFKWLIINYLIFVIGKWLSIIKIMVIIHCFFNSYIPRENVTFKLNLSIIANFLTFLLWGKLKVILLRNSSSFTQFARYLPFLTFKLFFYLIKIIFQLTTKLRPSKYHQFVCYLLSTWTKWTCCTYRLNKSWRRRSCKKTKN